MKWASKKKMKNKTISIPEDMFERLGKELNASALITRLLLEHYRLSQPDKDLIEQLTLEEQEILEKAKSLQEKKQRIIEKLESEGRLAKDQEEREILDWEQERKRALTRAAFRREFELLSDKERRSFKDFDDFFERKIVSK